MRGGERSCEVGRNDVKGEEWVAILRLEGSARFLPDMTGCTGCTGLILGALCGRKQVLTKTSEAFHGRGEAISEGGDRGRVGVVKNIVFDVGGGRNC
jgi:hypothetical protein